MRSNIQSTRKRILIHPKYLTLYNHYVGTLDNKNIDLLSNVLPITNTGHTQTADNCFYYYFPSAFEIRQRKKISFDREDLLHIPIRDINDALSVVAGMYQQKRGAPLYADGAGAYGNLYIIDHMLLMKN